MPRKEVYSKTYSNNEIPLMLNSYQDIFSDLDPRDYIHKALSGDFILECKKASIEKKDKIKLKLFIPKDKRNLNNETQIKKRLKEHFNKHFLEKKEDLKKLKRQGFFWFVLGCSLIVLTSLPLQENLSLILKILINISHPAGWFFLWEGLGKILLTSKEKKPDFIFYKKMANSEISFLDY